PRTIPTDQYSRQRGSTVPAGDRTVRHRTARPRRRLVDGCVPDLPVGGEPPGDGDQDVAVLWFQPYQPAQRGFPGECQSCPHHRSVVPGRLVRATTHAGTACRGTSVRGLGILAGVLLAGHLPTVGVPFARRFPRRLLGG